MTNINKQYREVEYVKQEITLKKINGDQYEKTLRNGTCAYYLT